MVDRATALKGDVPLAERLAVFEIDADTNAALERISPILRPHARALAEEYLDRFIRNSGLSITPDQRADQIARITHYSGNKYTPPIDAEWMARIQKMGWVNHRVGAAVHAAMGALSHTHRTAAQLVFAAIPDRAEAEHLVDHFMRVATMESEVLISSMRACAKADRDEDKRLRAEQYRAQIADAIVAARTTSETASDQSASAERVSHDLLARAAEVAAAADQSATAMQSAAETSATLIQAIGQVRSEINTAGDKIDQAARQADSAMAMTAALAEHGKAIETIAALIRDIAGQTNLLALNATIEAARAGDAGRGFAVVAQEVKSLANQTARATEEIERRIADIRSSSTRAVEANRALLDAVSDVRASGSRVQAAMSEQASTVGVIASSVDETALSAASMSHAIEGIREASEAIVRELGLAASATVAVVERLGSLQGSSATFLESFGA